jgi:hypothetical protein
VASDAARLSRVPVKPHPSQSLVSTLSSEAGGPLVRVNGGGIMVVGVMVGAGKTHGFAERLDNTKVQNWISYVVATTANAALGTIGGSSLHFANVGADEPDQDGPADPVKAGAPADDDQIDVPPDFDFDDAFRPGGFTWDMADPQDDEHPIYQEAQGEYAGSRIFVGNQDMKGINVDQGNNYWSGMPTKDKETQEADREFMMMAGDGAFFVVSHGSNGGIDVLPPKSAVADAVKSGKPIVLTICDAGMVRDGDTDSLAAKLATAWGADPANVYACDGIVGDHGDCHGTWFNAQGIERMPPVPGVTFENNAVDDDDDDDDQPPPSR